VHLQHARVHDVPCCRADHIALRDALHHSPEWTKWPSADTQYTRMNDSNGRSAAAAAAAPSVRQPADRVLYYGRPVGVGSRNGDGAESNSYTAFTCTILAHVDSTKFKFDSSCTANRQKHTQRVHRRVQASGRG
jgi:hypothetical protein